MEEFAEQSKDLASTQKTICNSLNSLAGLLENSTKKKKKRKKKVSTSEQTTSEDSQDE